MSTDYGFEFKESRRRGFQPLWGCLPQRQTLAVVPSAAAGLSVVSPGALPQLSSSGMLSNPMRPNWRAASVNSWDLPLPFDCRVLLSCSSKSQSPSCLKIYHVVKCEVYGRHRTDCEGLPSPLSFFTSSSARTMMSGANPLSRWVTRSLQRNFGWCKH